MNSLLACWLLVGPALCWCTLPCGSKLDPLPPSAGEVLDGGNKYKCPRQQKAVRAVKRMTVDSAPNVLMIQLKRFEFSFSGHKISKKVGCQSGQAQKGAPLALPPQPSSFPLFISSPTDRL